MLSADFYLIVMLLPELENLVTWASLLVTGKKSKHACITIYITLKISQFMEEI